MIRRALITALCLTACATAPRFRSDSVKLGTMLVDAQQANLALEDPLALTAEMREAAIVQVGRQGTELERLRRLSTFLRDKAHGLGFTYNGEATRTAAAAFETRNGDCLSYAFLYTAMARSLGIGVNFVKYREASTYDERNGQFQMVSHVAALFTDYRMSVLVELTGEPPSTRVSDYEPIGDDEAAALLMSNLAMEQFAAGDRAGPEKVLRFLVQRTPRLPEVHNNLAAVLLRQGRAHEALPIVTAALQRFPEFLPLYVNGALAARNTGNEAQSVEWAEKARSSFTDPFMPFVKGVWLYEQKHYVAADQLIRRARSLKPTSALFAAWQARVELKRGLYDEALQTLEEAAKLNPEHPLVEEVRTKDLVAARHHPSL